MTGIRPAAVVGTFYPNDAERLAETVDALIEKARPLGLPAPKALILPHAGYRYSGAVAAAGVAALPPDAPVRRVVVAGPSHHFAFRGVAVPAADAFRTPLGEMPVDRGAVDRLAREADVVVDDAPHAPEHAIEVELPFLQRQLGPVEIVPMVVGAIEPARMADLLATVWGGEETLIVISTDLSHFLDAAAAEARDGATARAIERAGTGMGPEDACGARALAGFLHAANARGMRITRLGLTHSGKVAGDMSRVVGYGAWMAQEQDAARLPDADREAALRLSRLVLRSRARKGKAPEVATGSFALPLQGMGASFVTLTRGGNLRGCIGTLEAARPLAEDIAQNTVRSGFGDPRFKPLTEDEIDGLEMEIAILGAPAEMAFGSEAELLAMLRPGEDGLILEDGGARGTFLPKVWDALTTPEQFLSQLKVKAGLARDHWSGTVRVWRYTTESFSGPA